MAKEYEAPKTINRVMIWLSRRGWGPSSVLTTIGRRSGRPRDVPVSPISHDGDEYLVAPYGAVGWVLNARANPIVSLTRGKSRRQIRLTEVDRPEIVKAYHDRESYARGYMDVPPEPTVDDFVARPGMFPVFRVDET